ncbi:restriction endonuclease subunit S [Ligilactobacillus agilis]|nr:restriction endonuclease subunit S [Ligilactobacillus agilis]
MKYRLRDLAQIKYGKDHKKLKDGNIPVYGTGGLMRKVNEYLYDGKSVLIPRKGSLNNVMYVTGKFWTVDTMFWTHVDDSKVIPKYLYYCLSKMDLESLNVGSAVPSLTTKILNEIILDIPPKEKQKEIIDKLAPIEEKVRLNNKINDNLGKLIDLDFNKTLGNNSLESVTIDNLGSIIGGGTPSKKIAEYWNGDIPWITPKDLSKSKRLFTSSGNLWITNEGLAKSSAKILPIGTVLYSSRAPIGYISIADNPITTNQGFKSIVPNKGYSTEFIFELLKKETDNLINSANGSTFKEISGTQLKNHIVKIPTKLVCQQFSERVQPMFRIIRKLEQENFVLLQIKELLLNKFF